MMKDDRRTFLHQIGASTLAMLLASTIDTHVLANEIAGGVNDAAGKGGVLPDMRRLLVMEDIMALRKNFCAALDRNDARMLADMIADDIEVHFMDESGQGRLGMDELVNLQGRTAFVDFVGKTRPKKRIHMATMPQIAMEGSHKARGRWLMKGYSEDLKANGSLGFIFEYIEDEYVLDKGKWKFKKMDIHIEAIV